DADGGVAGDDVIHLVLGVRLLAVLAEGREHIEPAAERAASQELQVRLAGLGELASQVVQRERVHRARPPARRGGDRPGLAYYTMPEVRRGRRPGCPPRPSSRTRRRRRSAGRGSRGW